jgi:hypothetical protein
VKENVNAWTRASVLKASTWKRIRVLEQTQKLSKPGFLPLVPSFEIFVEDWLQMLNRVQLEIAGLAV